MSDWRARSQSPEQVIAHLTSGQQVFVQGAAATPAVLLEELKRSDLSGLQLYHLHLEGVAELSRQLRSCSFFVGPCMRRAVEEGRADYIPMFLSDIPATFRNRRIPLDAALIQVSPPDRHGNCSLGTSVDVTLAAVQASRLILAQVNPRMPRTHGPGQIPWSRIDAFCVTDSELPSRAAARPGEVEQRIAHHVAELIPDGATLQLGIGAIPNAVLGALTTRNDLGVHTETFSDGLLPLLTSGVINNRRKRILPGVTVTSFVSGSRALYDYVDDNPSVEFHPSDEVNDPGRIRQNPRVCAVNSALEIDLSGQVCADSLGHTIFSGIGGQMDFIRGAALSPEGKPIIALPATACGGRVSRIVAELQPGAGVVTTRGHLHWVVTEYGAVDVHGLSLRRRADALIALAHPDHRPELARQMRRIRHFSSCRPG